MDIKEINFTEEDFELIIEALEFLPHKGTSGKIMASLIGAMLTRDDPQGREEIKRQQMADERAERVKNDLLKENIRILQSKLIMLKRHMIENDLLKQANDSMKQ